MGSSQSPKSRKTRKDRHGSLVFGLGGALVLVGGGLLGAYFLKVQDAEAGASTASLSVDDSKKAAMVSAASTLLKQSVEVNFGDHSKSMTWADLGLVVDERAAAREAALATNAGDEITPDYFARKREGRSLPLATDRKKSSAILAKMKAEFDLAPQNARIDLEGRKVHKAVPGRGIDPFASITALETAARSGADTVELAGVELPPEVTVDDLGIAEIGHVLSSFTTRFSVGEKSRNSNLKLAASRINGHIINPGETMSFNKVVGARDLEDGYKVAHVITAGEMVDGMAGGACQISTTLHGAAFFSGLDIVKSTPHSRPSTYVQMGLDATVVWPNTDLVVRNPYDFPVIVHYKVARGESVVEILGKERPYDKIAFERSVKKQLPFDTITREDNGLPVGSMKVEQDGFPGYRLERRRKFYKNGKVVKTDRWNLRYRPVTEYVRLGINPDPNLPPPKQGRSHGPRPPRGNSYRMVQ